MQDIMKIIEGFESQLNEIENNILKSSKIAILGHVNPDGDCIGSQIALYEGLKIIGKDVTLINSGEFKGIYKKYEPLFTKDIENEYDLFIITDSANLDRVSADYNRINLNNTIVIDHHTTNENFGKINWVSDQFISTSEMIYLLFYHLKIDIKNTLIPQYLINGILADNGYFQHIRTNKYLSLLITYLIVQDGGNPNTSFDEMFCNNTLDSEKLFGITLERLSSLKDGKILWSYIYDEDRAKFNNSSFESAVIFKEMLSIRTTKVAVFFKIFKNENRVDVSFRSRDEYDLSVIAQCFGGGGHKVACGASVKGSFKDIKEKVLKKVEALFD